MADEAIEAAATLIPVPPEPDPSRHSTPHDLRLKVLSGSAIMLVSSVLVGIVNMVYNFAVAHELGADRFGHASVVYTVLMLLSAVTLSFQLLCSKFVARSGSQAERIAIYHLLHRRSWLAGIGIGVALASCSSGVARYLNLPSSVLVQVLAVGTVFYIPLGTRRGFMQGTYDFVPLAINYVLEVVIKLVGALVLVSAGYGVPGVVGAISASVLVAYFVGVPRKQHFSAAPQQATLRAGMGEGVQALIFFVGQVIINNLDIILVKHFFDATQAGVYAAIALIGRIVYMLTWSVVSSMFPFSAGSSEERGGRTVLSTALFLASGISGVFVCCAWLAPAGLWPILLGKGFPPEGHHFYSSLLVLYAVTTAVYSLSVVLMTYEISRKIGNVSWMQLSFSGAIIVGIYLFHGALQTVILVQLVVMMVLLFSVSLPFLRGPVSPEALDPTLSRLHTGLRKIRRVDENEVIAEFLRSEFYQDEFRRYRKRFAMLVSHPDFTSERENSLRRALLYRRRGRLWQELPPDTEWWEVELTPAEISRMRVFPRNQWLRYGVPSFLLPETVDRIRARILARANDGFIEKLRSLSLEMKDQQRSEFDSVILITIDERTPLTIIEGNHRMTAAALGIPEEMHRRFRFMCGFSPHMAECCWYQTDISTLWRYAKNTIAFYVKHRRKIAAEIAA